MRSVSRRRGRPPSSTIEGYHYPPEYGPLAAVTPGTPGGLMTMLAEYGTMSLAEVLAPAIQMADGYPIEAQTANTIERQKAGIKQWKYSRALFLTHAGQTREAPEAGEIFVQKDLAATFRKLVEAERRARRREVAEGGDLRRVRPLLQGRHRARDGARRARGRRTVHDAGPRQLEGQNRGAGEHDLQGHRGLQAPALAAGPAMLQALNILENADLKAMGYNSPKYMHAIYQAMNLAFADRDFYYGDPYFAPDEPTRASLEGIREGALCGDRLEEERPDRQAGRSVSVPEGRNPFAELLRTGLWLLRR